VGEGQQTRCFHAEGLDGVADWHRVLSERISKAERELASQPAAVEPGVVSKASKPAQRHWTSNAGVLSLACVVVFFVLSWAKRTPWGNTVVRAQTQLVSLAAEVRGFGDTMGRYPATIDELGYRLKFVFADGRALDPWGRAYVYTRTAPTSEATAPSAKGAFELRSLGPDGVPSEDDLHSK
jgi:hypothetical protein